MKEFAPYYCTVYIIIIMLATLYKSSMMNTYGYKVLFQRDSNLSMVMILMVLCLIFGFRPVSGVYFGDTRNYANTYEVMQNVGTLNVDDIGLSEGDWLFNMLMFECSQFLDVHSFFFLIMFLYTMVMHVGCRELDSRHSSMLMLFCIGAFSFYGYAINGIRNGLACSFVILAVAGVCKKERIWPIIFSFIAIGIHKSAALPVVCMFFTFFIRNHHFMFAAWGGAFLLSLIYGESISQIFTLINYDERLAENINDSIGDAGELQTSSGFRWDFFIYGIMPILLGAYTLYVRKVYNNTYLILLGTYIYANSFWLFVNRSFYSNRFAYLSWFIYPIVLAYPLFNLPVFEKNHSKKVVWILWAHLSFTVMMRMLGK